MDEGNIPVIPRLNVSPVEPESYSSRPGPMHVGQHPSRAPAVSAPHGLHQGATAVGLTQGTVSSAGKSLMEIMSEYKYWILGAIIVILLLIGVVWWYTRDDAEADAPQGKSKPSQDPKTKTGGTLEHNQPQLSDAEKEARRKKYDESLRRGEAARSAVSVPAKPAVVPPVKTPMATRLEVNHDIGPKPSQEARVEDITEDADSCSGDEETLLDLAEEPSESSAVQPSGKCTGVTKNGRRCTRKAVSAGKCLSHG